jgi:hypothetical protein
MGFTTLSRTAPNSASFDTSRDAQRRHDAGARHGTAGRGSATGVSTALDTRKTSLSSASTMRRRNATPPPPPRSSSESPASKFASRALYDADRTTSGEDIEMGERPSATDDTPNGDRSRWNFWGTEEGSCGVMTSMTGVLGAATVAGGWLGYGHVAHALNISPIAGCAVGAASAYIGVPLATYAMARPFREGAVMEFLVPPVILPAAVLAGAAHSGGNC